MKPANKQVLKFLSALAVGSIKWGGLTGFLPGIIGSAIDDLAPDISAHLLTSTDYEKIKTQFAKGALKDGNHHLLELLEASLIDSIDHIYNIFQEKIDLENYSASASLKRLKENKAAPQIQKIETLIKETKRFLTQEGLNGEHLEYFLNKDQSQAATELNDLLSIEPYLAENDLYARWNKFIKTNLPSILNLTFTNALLNPANEESWKSYQLNFFKDIKDIKKVINVFDENLNGKLTDHKNKILIEIQNNDHKLSQILQSTKEDTSLIKNIVLQTDEKTTEIKDQLQQLQKLPDLIESLLAILPKYNIEKTSDEYEKKVAIIDFEIKLSNQILPEDFITDKREKDKFLENFYFKREIYHKEILTNYEVEKSMVITGRKENGKTRTIYEFIKNDIPSTKIFIGKIREINHPESHLDKDFQSTYLSKIREKIEKGLSQGARNVFIFDDFETFTSSYFFEEILNNILEVPKQVIIASSSQSKKGKTNKLLKQSFTEYSDLSLNEIHLPKIEGEEVLELKKIVNSSFEAAPITLEEFDGTIGSLWGLKTKREKYANFEKLSPERQILISYACIDYISVNSKGSVSVIDKLVDLRYRKIYQEKEISIDVKRQALDHLIRLEFISEDKDKDKIFVEENVLRKIIHEDEYPKTLPNGKAGLDEWKMSKDILACYIDYDKDILAKIYNKLIYNQSENKQQSAFLYNEMLQKKLPINQYTINGLIKGRDLEDAKEILTQFIEEHPEVELNTFTLNILIPKYSKKDFIGAKKLYFDFIKTHSIVPDTYTLNVLITRASDFTEAWDIYVLYISVPEYPRPNTSNLYNLLKIAKTFSQGMLVYEEFLSNQLSVNAQLCVSIIRKPGDPFDKAWDLYLIAKDKDISKIDTEVLSQLLRKAPNPYTVQLILEDIRKSGKEALLNSRIYTAIIKKLETLNESLSVLDDMEDSLPPSKLRPNPYNAAMEKTRSHDKRLTILQRIKANNVSPDSLTYRYLINASSSYEKAKAYLGIAKEENLKIDLHFYIGLLGTLDKIIDRNERNAEAAKLFNEAELLLPNYDKDNHADYYNAYQLLIRKVDGFDGKLKVIESFHEIGMKIVEKDFIGAASRTQSLDDAIQICDKMKACGVTPYELLPLLQNNLFESENYSTRDIKSFYSDLIEKYQVKPINLTILFDYFIAKCNNPQEIVDVYRILINNERLKEKKFSISYQSNVNLIWAFSELHQEQDALNLLKDNNFGVKFQPEFLEEILNRFSNFDKAKNIYYKAKELDIKPTLRAFELLLDLAFYEEQSDQINVFDWAKESNDEYSDLLFSKVIISGINLKNKISIFNTIVSKNHTISARNIKFLYWRKLRSTNFDFDQTNSNFPSISIDNLENSKSYFIKKCSSFSEALSVLLNINRSNPTIETSDIEALLEYVKKESELKEILELIDQHEVPYTGKIVLSIVRYSKDYNFAKNKATLFLKSGDKEDLILYDDFITYLLIKKATTVKEAYPLYKDFQLRNFSSEKKISEQILLKAVGERVDVGDYMLQILDDFEEKSSKVPENTIASISQMIIPDENSFFIKIEQLYSKNLLHNKSSFYKILNLIHKSIPTTTSDSFIEHFKEANSFNEQLLLLKFIHRKNIILTNRVLELIISRFLNPKTLTRLFTFIKRNKIEILENLERKAYNKIKFTKTELAEITPFFTSEKLIDEVIDELYRKRFSKKIDQILFKILNLKIHFNERLELYPKYARFWKRTNENMLQYFELLFVLINSTEDANDAWGLYEPFANKIKLSTESYAKLFSHHSNYKKSFELVNSRYPISDEKVLSILKKRATEKES